MDQLDNLIKKYECVPFEMRQTKRWICYRKAILGNGMESKSPINPLSDGTEMAKADDPSTWADFEAAIRFCYEHDLDGIGYELNGSDIYAVSIKNRVGLSQKEYQDMANNLVKSLDSYTEWGDKGDAVHVFCYGSKTSTQTSIVKIHAGKEYMEITGDKIGYRGIRNADEAVDSFLKQLESKKEEKKSSSYAPRFKKMTDAELIDTALASKNGPKIDKLLKGNIFDYPSEKEAKQALCNYLMWFSDCDFEQAKRIYLGCDLGKRTSEEELSPLLRSAADNCVALSNKRKETKKEEPKPKPIISNDMNIDADGEPIFHIAPASKRTKKYYTLDDTGNAQRFYDLFGEHFRWDASNQYFMFWTGRTWRADVKGYIRKYANKLIELLREESAILGQKVKDASNEEVKKNILRDKDAFDKNIKHLASKNGKDAMLNELHSMGKMSVEPDEFDKDKDLLNTLTGIVNLKTGEITPHDRSKMMSLNCNVEVSFEEPKRFVEFLREILPHSTPEESDECMEFMQRYLGYTLTGYTNEQCMSLLHGDGSNGKSTFANVLTKIMGDYCKSIDSEELMAKGANVNASVKYSLAELRGIRFLLTQETDDGDTIKEKLIKGMTGDDKINARRPYGRPFDFYPEFKLWMMTNNLPNIRGTDYGIWRRVLLVPFYKQFKDEEKDKTLPEKLAKEYPQILGWCIKGAVKYIGEYELHYPEVMKKELRNYKNENDVTQIFILEECDSMKERKIKKSVLYEAFKNWAKSQIGWSMSEPKFKKQMVRKGYNLITDDNGVFYYDGICLKDMNKWTSPSEIKRLSSKPEDLLD